MKFNKIIDYIIMVLCLVIAFMLLFKEVNIDTIKISIVSIFILLANLFSSRGR